MKDPPSVTVGVPVFNEGAHIDACLEALAAQSYPDIVEILVVDGGSSDGTRDLASRHAGVRVLDNPRRIQAAALNIALREARGDIFVRVDGHTVVAPDYVERCVEVLGRTGAAMVGGMMTPVGDTVMSRGIAAALASPLGVGPARFHTGGAPGWVDTVYLGAFRTLVALAVGGYAEVAVNEDAEFAIRMGRTGGVWFDESIRSKYSPRRGLGSLALQFWRYGRGRAVTVRSHPTSLAVRQLAPPALVLGLLSPWKRTVATCYGLAIAITVGRRAHSGRRGEALASGLAMPVMHLSWGLGFLEGLAAGGKTIGAKAAQGASGRRSGLDRSCSSRREIQNSITKQGVSR